MKEYVIKWNVGYGDEYVVGEATDELKEEYAVY